MLHISAKSNVIFTVQQPSCQAGVSAPNCTGTPEETNEVLA